MFRASWLLFSPATLLYWDPNSKENGRLIFDSQFLRVCSMILCTPVLGQSIVVVGGRGSRKQDRRELRLTNYTFPCLPAYLLPSAVSHLRVPHLPHVDQVFKYRIPWRAYHTQTIKPWHPMASHSIPQPSSCLRKYAP